jgi:hypothetical protein
MAFLVQNDSGSVAGANALITLAEFATYAADRGWDIGAYNDAARQVAIVKATDHLNTRFSYVGERLQRTQRTEWPRMDAYDADNNYVNGIPQEVKDATSEYARIALTADLNPAPARDDYGQAVQARSERVGPIEQSVEYRAGAAWTMPIYPTADRFLTVRGLVRRGSSFKRS